MIRNSDVSKAMDVRFDEIFPELPPMLVRSPGRLTEEAVTAMTINAAAAIGSRIGSAALMSGKRGIWCCYRSPLIGICRIIPAPTPFTPSSKGER